MPLAIIAVLTVAYFVYRQHQKDSAPPDEPGPYATATINKPAPKPIAVTSKPRRVVRKVSSPRAGMDRQGLFGRVDPNDFARGHSVSGFSTSQLIALARSQAPTYGNRFVPHNLATEGEIFKTSNGKRYINVKFINPNPGVARNTSTEKVYLP